MSIETASTDGSDILADNRAAIVPALTPDILYGVRITPLPPSEIPILRPDLERFPLPQYYPWNRIQQHIGWSLAPVMDADFALVPAPPSVDADFAVATHSTAKSLGQKPGEVATDLAEGLNKNPIPQVARIKAAQSGYVNFEVDTPSLGREVLEVVERMGDEYGHQNTGDGRVVVLDVSSPNVAKPMSVGHLRSTAIGESLARIYRAGGFRVIRDNHLGDWGTQFGMMGRAKELWEEEIDQEMPDADRLTKIYELYKRMNARVNEEKAPELESLKLENPGIDEKRLKTRAFSALEQEGRDWFARLEKGDPEALALLEETTALSLVEFRRIYELLGTEYEYLIGESFYAQSNMSEDVIDVLLKRGIASQDETGAVIIEFPEGSNLNRQVIRKSDGTSLYSTRDLATLVARTAWFDPERILYVVGGEQKAYFSELFAAFEMLTQGEGPKAEHVYFGMISSPEGGKMSSRIGNVVFLGEVLEEAITRARAKVTESNRDMSPEETETVARQVGIGAVIYMDLGQGRERNIRFDMDQALSLEGNSAPYIQYAHARAKSLLRKASALGIMIDHEADPKFDLPIEAELVKQLAQFPGAIAKALESNEPSVIATYIYKVAELFSRFYKETGAIIKADPTVRNTRLRLASASAQVIKNGLNLLGIESPEKM